MRSILIMSCALTFSIQIYATPIGYASEILDDAKAAKLEAWLGNGPIKLTNIFTKDADDTSYDFHAQVDGKGPTFVLFSVTSGATGETNIVGGYNPVSWSSDNVYNMTPDPAEKVAFIFNLSKDIKLTQRLDFQGDYQTYNNSAYGPTFGGGHDIFVGHELSSVHSWLWSYGADEDLTQSIVPNSRFNPIQKMEVFAITAVPEPSAFALAGIGALIVLRSKKRHPV
ncbi:PEP_CTERM-anchored TLD domain-containing protein [Aquabacterium sp.]|uniref:PEP_CTERM-anchored TLD domain-containing protein n=1 Tax=Aquabacterium sp. TaxID=1872578 RepID=UPI002E33DE94|nr:PEP_CTERM-anchored TLD domain-containing protein [Aquabacterium sp.]HEX5310549.1 PEP_CTERM-anchored TLD domain-containing protein [Aquabacterium sp.]